MTLPVGSNLNNNIHRSFSEFYLSQSGFDPGARGILSPCQNRPTVCQLKHFLYFLLTCSLAILEDSRNKISCLENKGKTNSNLTFVEKSEGKPEIDHYVRYWVGREF